jgi:hypothetical protein
MDSVNTILETLDQHAGQLVHTYGVISFEFEGNCIAHIPRAEIREGKDGVYDSSMWISYDLDELGVSHDQLDRFNLRQVEVQGYLSAPDPEFGGCGHFSLWPAELRLTKIQKYRPNQ